MAFAISGCIIVIQMGFKSLDNARSSTLAAQIMQSEMERIRLLNWSNITALPASDAINLSTIFPSGTTSTAMIGKFSAVRTVATVASRDDEMKSITITVTWSGLDGQSHRRSTTTYYCKNGLYDYYYTLAES